MHDVHIIHSWHIKKEAEARKYLLLIRQALEQQGMSLAAISRHEGWQEAYEEHQSALCALHEFERLHGPPQFQL